MPKQHTTTAEEEGLFTILKYINFEPHQSSFFSHFSYFSSLFSLFSKLICETKHVSPSISTDFCLLFISYFISPSYFHFFLISLSIRVCCALKRSNLYPQRWEPIYADDVNRSNSNRPEKSLICVFWIIERNIELVSWLKTEIKTLSVELRN